jgi:hypothetical protein
VDSKSCRVSIGTGGAEEWEVRIMYHRGFWGAGISFIGRIFLTSLVILSLTVLVGCAGKKLDIVVVEDSTNDNGYLTGKALMNPGAIRATSKQDMVTKVLAKLGSRDCIKTLTLIGHGSPGNISVGDGQGWESCKHVNGNRDEWESILAKLKGKFCKDAKLILFGCNVGACDKGRNKLQELADFLNVTVEAPTGKTYGNCTEEAGSQHQIATPGGTTPPHKPSPSDAKRKDMGMPTGAQMVPFDVESLTGLAIYSAQLPIPAEPEKLEYTYTTKDDVLGFISGIDFSKTVDGTGLGADYDAHVFLSLGEEVVEYRICSDFEYFLAKDDWENMYEITWELDQKLSALMEQQLKKGD